MKKSCFDGGYRTRRHGNSGRWEKQLSGVAEITTTPELKFNAQNVFIREEKQRGHRYGQQKSKSVCFSQCIPLQHLLSLSFLFVQLYFFFVVRMY